MPWRRALVIVPLAALATSVMAGPSSEEAVSSTPKIVLDSRLERIFVVSACKWISGLTCRITYNGKDALPSRVFFTEQDVEGNLLGAKVRLIYPKLRAGEKGWATFRLKSPNPASINLAGEWKGRWRDPY